MMDINGIVTLVVNNGIGVACIIYFIYRDNKFMNTLNDTLSSLRDSVNLIQKYFIEERNHKGE